MSKKEKYYNFIVDDLVKKTEIDYDQDVVTYPFSNFQDTIEICFKTLSHDPLYSKTLPIYRFFGEHCENVYGTQDDEVEIIWDLYKERMISIINND